MASTIFHWVSQLKDNDELKLFINSKQYSRDFIWVEDVAKTIYHFMYRNYQPGIYDLGTGSSIDFETVADLMISNTNKGIKKFIDMPDDLKEQYQINTVADTKSLIEAGITVEDFIGIEAGIKKYMDYLVTNRYY
jgi:nucleoside-diphosphate-sugar epimerase